MRCTICGDDCDRECFNVIMKIDQCLPGVPNVCDECIADYVLMDEQLFAAWLSEYR